MLYDKMILGAGLYGLYSALFCAKRGEHVLVLEYDNEAFKRATYINQARVHMGYHYPRSISTAIKSRKYFDRFNEEFGFSIHSKFEQIYATSANFSWTNAAQFKKFCYDANIKCEEVPINKYFNEGECDGAFLTKEYTYDAQILKEYFMKEISKYPDVDLKFSVNIRSIERKNDVYEVILNNEEKYSSAFVLNSTYASINQIHAKLNYEPFKIKYELCEIILCKIGGRDWGNTGITVMDGPFFSLMPFGKTGCHSLTSVSFTPHYSSHESVPTFSCQDNSKGYCTPEQLGNCNECQAKPESAYPYMSKLARKYLKKEYGFEYIKSLYSMKPILKESEIDDSRPTVIKQFSMQPRFISVLSGKINTVYDLDEVLSDAK